MTEDEKQSVRTAKETTQGKPTVLIGFIALSFLAHGLLFLFQTNSQNQLTHASLGNSKLSISLVNADTKIKNNTTTQEKLTNKKPLQKTTQGIVEKITIVTKPVQIMVTAHNYASTTIKKSKQQTTPDARQRNFLLGEIQHRLWDRYIEGINKLRPCHDTVFNAICDFVSPRRCIGMAEGLV